MPRVTQADTDRSTSAGPDASRPGAVRPVGRPVGRSTDLTKREVLDAARRCFAESGYAGASIKEIARAAGVTPGTVRYHFGGKGELFLAVHEDIQDYSLSRCAAALEGQRTMFGALEALFDALAGAQSRPADVLRFNALARIEAARHPELASARDDSRWRALFAEISHLGVSSGEIPPGDDHAVRALMAILVTGLAHHAAAAAHGSHMEGFRALKAMIAGRLVVPQTG